MPPLTAITSDWRPGDAVYQLLAQHNISRAFIDDQIAEFILYWQERGQQNHSWGSKFAKHVIHEWRLHEIKQAQLARIKAMTPDWQPSNKARQALGHLGIPGDFIDACVLTFRLYWMDRGEVSSTWNSRFVDHVKHNHASSRKQIATTANLATIRNSSTRDIRVMDQLADRTWADGQ